MTVPAQIPYVVHTGNGVTNTFPFPFKVLLIADLDVTVNGVPVSSLGYSVAGLGEEGGGSITLNVTPSALARIVLRRDVGLSRATDYQYAGDFQSDTVNKDFDRLWMAMQDQTLNLTTALRFPADDNTNPLLPPIESRALTMLTFDAAGAPALLPVSASDATGLALALTSGAGAGMVGFRHIGASAVTRTLQSRGREIVSIQDYGALDDYDGVTPITNSLAALSAIFAAFPTGCIIRMPKTNTGRYYLNGNAPQADLSLFTIDPDPGVSVHYIGTGCPLVAPGLTVTRPLDIRMATLGYTYRLSPNSYSPTQQKPRWLSAADADAPIVENVSPAASMVFNTVNVSTGALATTAASTDAISASFGSISTTGFTVGTLAIRPGQEVHAQATMPSMTGSLCAFVQTEAGWVMFSQPNVGGSMTRLIAVAGFPVQSVSFTYPVEIQPYWLVNAEIGIRVHSPRSFSLLANHVEIARIDDLTSNIIRAGWGVGLVNNTNPAYITTPARIREKKTMGRRPISVVCAGDSITTQGNPFSWVNHFRRAIAGVAGVQVKQLLNIAVAGQTSVQQKDLLLAQNLGGYDFALIAVGVNDIGGASTPDQFVAAVESMINHCLTYNVMPIVGLPSMFYLAADAAPYGQTGQATANANNGAPYRLKLLRKLADLRVQVNVMPMEDMGAVVPSLLGNSAVDPIVQDNVHPSGFGGELIGLAWAKAVAGVIIPPVRKDTTVATIQPGWIPSAIAANYGVGTKPSYQVVGDRFSMGGLMDTPAPVPTNTVIIVFPAAYAPTQSIVGVLACADAGGVPNLVCNYQIDTGGSLRVFNVPATSRYFFFGGVQYSLAS